VTQGEWKFLMETEPWKGGPYTQKGDDFPATYVTWDAATKFCDQLTQQERAAGRLPDDWEYSLPSEAQWERACRAGTETRFSFGDEAGNLRDYTWCGDTRDGKDAFAHRVGQKKPNAWGLYDMHGNVWEWCQDWYAPKLPGGRNPLVTEQKADAAWRVVRGGGWGDAASNCRSGYHFAQNPRHAASDYGFRVVLRYLP
jgi:formylglycine-generating enzyme required for sulfatase activity